MLRVVVIGVGPAGAAALRRLEELGVKAIGIERKKSLETPTVCGEFLPEPTAISFISNKPSVKKAYQYIALARKLNTFREVHLEIEGIKTFKMKIPGFTVNRKELVEKLAGNSELILGDDIVSVLKTPDGYLIKTRKGVSIESEYIIAADGFPSTTRRIVNCPARLSEVDLALGINVKAETPNMDKKIVYMYASPKTPGGYAWIIPYNGSVSNVGVGIRYNFVKKGENISYLLEEFIRLNPKGFLTDYSLLEAPRSRWIPVSGFYGSPVCGHVLFAGDSLGATNPINGGGIFTSMSLGILAADAVWLDNPTVYEQRAWNEIGSILEIGRAYRKLVDWFFENWSYAKIISLLPNTLITRIIKGEKTLLYPLLTLGTRS
ncbi:MAG: FAD-dependent monooxygenase [Infirmifilum sp.]|jgi:digeranylgeranylglycerophospholipid reductase|uniref:Uncharacterized protein n=1 Tax=Infirmifilum uzonense TaxID=1550241 RepID=A0A0F7FG81_9CREN|nr:NAD(P)/FAD-dependent oxidoreductase [Infirmifilum uzonense]AKG38139.1 hypothetical protein MA03_00905 [Infirmifilum uzonense]